MTLDKKLFLYTGSLLIALLLIILLVLERGQAAQWEEYLRAQSISFAHFATPEILKTFRGSFPPQNDLVSQPTPEIFSLNPDLLGFALYTPAGRLLYRSTPSPDQGEEALSRLIAPDVQRLQNDQLTVATRVLDDGRRVLDLVNPAVNPTGEHVLSVRFLISCADVAQRQAETRVALLRIALIAIPVSLLLAAIAARRMTRPIKGLTENARAIARGDLQVYLQPKGRDELGTLARAFNEMAESLAASHRELTCKNAALLEANEKTRRMQEQLIRAERMAAIGQLAAGVSHEIDNPVGVILGYAELLQEEFPENDPRREDVRVIIDECKRCRRITGGLLGLARGAETHWEVFDLGGLIRETVDSLRPQKLFKEIDFDLAFPSEPVSVSGDPDKLRQVLINLLLNAAQSLKGQGRVRVEVAHEQGEVRFTVADNGPGISEGVRERIFEPFFSTKERGEGTGLGLAVCRKLVEEHGGRIQMISPTGGGAGFRVCLPLRAQEKNFDIPEDNSLG